MSESSIYSQILLSKTNLEIPLLKSGKTVDSRYDPQRESLRLLETLKEDTHFVIVLGIASGIFINTLLENRKEIFILAVEKSQADLDFLKKLPLVNKLTANKNLCFCSLENLEEKIIELYVPAFYGNLQVIEQRGWTSELTDLIPQINQSISRATGIVSADFSVQSHFGKLWQHNILSNLKNMEKLTALDINIPCQKKALVVAAGPSLDKTINILLQERQDYYVIATDTALSILTSYKIIPDAVLSIDGQNISNIHFIQNNKSSFENTLFLFDLCANSSAVKALAEQNYKVCFFTSGHPLSEFINNHFNLKLPSLFSGAGTVTISALDFAAKAGFKNIITAGADFSYSNGKPYAKGTYLDRLYNQKSNRMESFQKLFSALEFRTPLIQKEDSYTTQILQAYRTSFEQYLDKNGMDFCKEEDLYKITCPQKPGQTISIKVENIKAQALLIELKNIYNSKESSKEFNSIYELSPSDISLLPLISWLRNHDNKERSDFNYFYNKAISFAARWEEIKK